MADPDLGDLVEAVVDAVADTDLPWGGLRHERPTAYHYVLIGIVVALALAVYLFVW